MGRAPCCTKVGLHRGPWTPREDRLLSKYISSHGEGHWRSLPKKAGLLRCGKSCRLRWMNYLRPGIKRGNITKDEEDLIIRLHSLLGNRWSLIAGRLPGRTDNEIKNYWNTHLSRRLRRQGTDPKTHRETPPSHQYHCQRKPNANAGHEYSKVHVPKAVRVRVAVMSSAPKSDDTVNIPTSEGPWFNLKGSIAVDRDDEDLVHASDLEFMSCVPSSSMVDNTLEKLYEEYLQLLNNSSKDKEEDQVHLESFAESLFL